MAVESSPNLKPGPTSYPEGAAPGTLASTLRDAGACKKNYFTSRGSIGSLSGQPHAGG